METELDFTIEEATIQEIQHAFAEGKLTARQLVDFYLHQIESLNPVLRGVIEVNPDAQQLADQSDREKERSRIGSRLVELGELHGIPVLLKDTIGTNDKLNTTAGSYALLGSKVSRDAGVVARLRKAGAIVLGKTSLSEWYKFRSLSGVPNGWCARAGQGNPYLSSGTPCGSSSGSAISVAANMACVALGSETHSSIICPSDHNSVVGIKPTVGLTSRAGPICRTVSDAVYVLDVIAGLDPSDEATSEAAKFIPEGGYKQFLNENGLNGKRLGIVRHPFVDKMQDTAEFAAFELHLDTFRQRGAEVIDDLKIDHIDTILEPNHSGEISIMMADFKTSINVYLKELEDSPVRSLADVIAFNESNVELEKLTEYDQQTFVAAERTDGLGEHEKAILEKLDNLSKNGFEKLMKDHKLDAMVTPGSRACPVFAIGGYPAITVPAGYENDGMPFGICFGGLKGSTIQDFQTAFHQNKLTSKQLVEFYLNQIQKLNPLLKGIIEVNPDALYLAEKADREKKSNPHGSLSRLHGIPILLKDNIATKDKLNTTAGSFALLGSVVPRDAGVVKKLRKAGAIIIGKASLSEWASFRSLTAPNGWSARGGQGKYPVQNPYVLSADPCGSSSGSAISVASNMVAVSLGTETDGSIICPSGFNAVVGIKPTVCLTSRAGAYMRDSVDAVHVLDAIVGFDYNDAQATRIASKYIPYGGAHNSRLNICRLCTGRLHNNLNLGLDIRQEIFLASEATNGIGYAEKKATWNLTNLTKNGFEKLMTENKLDALVTAGPGVAPVLAIGGFPGITVPAAYDSKGVPVGICFGGLKGSEPKLIEIAYGFEQATKIRKPPTFLP
ncbi:hypothetical protein DH2020_029595 [Rehmannia glutinosa]|uniref:Amidase domain-containing protein n=1 Tax=Rehmannia glutinosa TaxID=99300 RepID=A0ABR0VQP0_REHGL